MADKQSLGPATQRLTFSLGKAVTADNIDAILKKVYVLAGCRNCGLLGYDVHLHLINPESLAGFQGIDNLLDVSNPGVRV